ncbi:MAG: C13 family peptidase [Gammaproteobacteria bacterium]
MKKVLAEFKANLLAGLKLISLRACRIDDFHVSLDQCVVLLLFDLILSIFTDYLSVPSDPEFSMDGFPAYGFGTLCFFFACYLIGKIINKPDALLQLVVVTFSAGPYLTGFYIADILFSDNSTSVGKTLFYGATCAYFFFLAVLLMRPVRIIALPMKRFAVLGFAVFAITWVLPSNYFGGSQGFWYQPDSEMDEEDPYADYRDIDAENLLYRQPDLLQEALEKLLPGKPGSNDLFFVSFAPYAYQDVFLKEANYTGNLLDDRFGTKDRSLRLINHLDTLEQTPLATATNLKATLQTIGRIMNPEEDVLILYLTSHGSSDHRLAVRFWPLPLNDIDPDMLRSMLDEAGIRWRVIIISACYSGGFIERLKDEHTLVATAAAANKTSFGCSNENDFTYFGEAVFKDQLSHDFSFLNAFRQAAINLGQRERAENLTSSEPQLYVGEAIRAKLEHLTSELTERYCRNHDPEPTYPLCG